MEEETSNKLPFLDTVIWRGDEGVKFSVYRKPTNKDDFIHYLSAHNDRTKSGVVIGFFLRAYRICSKEFIDEEIKYIISTFRKLCYPEGYILKLKSKAIKIIHRKREESLNGDANMNNGKERYICVPNSKNASVINKYLMKTGLRIATSSGEKIGEVTTARQTKAINEKSVIYNIPCKGCTKEYIGETGRGLKKRITEHKKDVIKHRTSNSLVLHIDKFKHLPNWEAASEIRIGLDKRMRKALEAAYITQKDVTNHREGFVRWSANAAKLALRSSDRRVR